MDFEPYKFQNIYIITTYRCNWRCPFCLFKFNKEKEAPIQQIVEQLEYSIKRSDKKVYVKITGGEPFLRKNLLSNIFKITNKYSDKIYKIGIGTNGSICLPKYFNSISNITHIFISRHHLNDNLLTPEILRCGISNPHIDFRINCNLIKGEIDNLSKIKKYITEQSEKTGVSHFCFRELSRVDIDNNSMYPKEVYDYDKYFSKHHVSLDPIFKEIKDDELFKYSRFTGNYYDKNHWYWFLNKKEKNKISVKFRSINEKLLLEFNKSINPDEVDEYVIHPDGTLTGCWDKDTKIIDKGGAKYA